MHGLKVEKVNIQILNILGVVASFSSVPVPLDACDGPYGPCVSKKYDNVNMYHAEYLH